MPIYRLRNFAALRCLGCQRGALLRGILRRKKSHVWRATMRRAVVLKWFYSLSRRETFVGGKCALPSAILVYSSSLLRSMQAAFESSDANQGQRF